MVKKADKLSVAELEKQMTEAAIRGGCLTDEQLEALHAARLKSLSETLSGQFLSDQQRTKIIDQSLLRLGREPETEPAPPAALEAGEAPP